MQSSRAPDPAGADSSLFKVLRDCYLRKLIAEISVGNNANNRLQLSASRGTLCTLCAVLGRAESRPGLTRNCMINIRPQRPGASLNYYYIKI